MPIQITDAVKIDDNTMEANIIETKAIRVTYDLLIKQRNSLQRQLDAVNVQIAQAEAIGVGPRAPAPLENPIQ